MAGVNYTKATAVRLKGHPELNEAWVQARIVEDPSILGLGDLVVKDVERILPKAGRLDLLLFDPDNSKRYEVELMLGATDESHIIRCIEYWDIERKRYPQYDHCAVIVAEDVTSRFLNVIGLFNGFIPIIAIKLTALQIGDQLILQFTKVIDELVLGDDDDGIYEPPADRASWETKASAGSLAIVDACLGILQEMMPRLALNYRQGYVGLAIGGVSRNFVIFRPKKEWVRLAVKVDDVQAWAERLDTAGITTMEGGRSKGRLVMRLCSVGEVRKHESLLRELFTEAYGGKEE